MDIVVRTRTTLVPAGEMRAVVARVVPGIPMYRISTMQERVASQLEQSHFDTFLLTIFATTALLLAAIGIYGVLSYTVAQRTREIGIRIALGATQTDITKDVLSQGLLLTGIGAAIGLVGAMAASRLIASILFGIKPTDVVTFVAASLIMGTIALIASYLPARRASRVDPMVALRYQ
jgi:putative ABC transport system permease protein